MKQSGTVGWVAAVGLVLELFCHCVALGSDITIPLEWREVENPTSLRDGMGVGIHWLAPTNTFAMPTSKSGQPGLYQFSSGGRLHHFLADTTATNTPYYDQLWYDRDGDRDFTDETPIEVRSGRYGKTLLWARATVKLDMELFGEQAPECIVEVAGPSLTNSPAKRTRRIERIWLKYARAGTLTVDDHSYQIGFFDTSSDGELSKNGDYMQMFSLDEPPPSPRAPRSQRIPQHLVVGSRTFRLELDPKGQFCLLRELSSDSTVSLTVIPDLVFAELNSSNGLVVMQDPEGTVRLPAADYTMKNCTMSRTNNSGAFWSIARHGDTNLHFSARGNTTKMDGHEPFALSCRVGPKGGNATIHDRNGVRMTTDLLQYPKPPRLPFTVTDSKGDIAREGHLGYG